MINFEFNTVQLRERMVAVRPSRFFLACCMLVFVLGHAQQAMAQFAGLNADELAKLKSLINNDSTARQAFAEWTTRADNALNDTPQPVSKINAEGKLAGDPDKIKTNIALRDMQKIYALGLTYGISGEKKYLNKAVEYLKAWAAINHSVGDPIDDTNLEDLIAGYDLVRKDADGNDRADVDKWLQETADVELKSTYTTPGRTNGMSNWNSHRVKIIAMVTCCLHNKEYGPIVEREFIRQLEVNLYADGSGYDLKVRDAMHYHTYTLEPLLTAAIVIYRATGKDFFNYTSSTGSSIKKSVDFFVPYVTGEKTHTEFVNSTIAFDKARASNGEKDFQTGAKFDARKGLHVLAQAAYFDAGYKAVLQQAAAAGIANANDWQLILNKIRRPFHSAGN